MLKLELTKSKAMFKTNFKLVLRQLWKQPIFTTINGVGLTLGLIAFLFIVQYVFFQWSFNEMYENRERVFRLLDGDEGATLTAYTAPGVAPRVKEQIPGVELSTRIMTGIGSGIILIENKLETQENSFREDDLAFVDDDFLQMFKLPVIKGIPDLKAPNLVVLTRSAALRYFQTVDVAGQTLKLINQFGEHPFRITAVIEDFPANSDIQTNVLASMSTFESKDYLGFNTWMDINTLNASFVSTYFQLSNPEVNDNVIAFCQQLMTQDNPERKMDIALQSLADMHLHAGESGNLPTIGDPRLVWFLMLLAVLILVIAWINYINLSTAQALKKAHSVSVRKVIGAARWQLMGQQLMETFILTGGGVALAIIGCLLLQPFFNYLTDLSLNLSSLLHWKSLSLLLAFIVMTSLCAGIYVAIVIVGLTPSTVLKGNFIRSAKGAWVRKSLVTAQFAITIAFIAGTLIMFLQIQFLQNKDMGIAMDGRLAILGPADFSKETVNNRNAFLNEIDQIPFIQKHSAAGGIPGRGINFSLRNLSRYKDEVDQSDGDYSMVFVDEHYFDIYEIELLGGKQPTPAMIDAGWWNTKKIYLNEAAALQLGYENATEAVQEVLYYKQNESVEAFEVAGVVADYNHQSLHSEVTPMVFGPGRNHVWFTLLLNGQPNQGYLGQLEQLYKAHFPKSPFIYQFVDEYYHQFYDEDRRLGQMISMATLLVIFISCLGLLGLVAFTVEQRTKEIGIRKVLGASVTHILTLISKEFIPLLLIASLIAIPMVYYYGNKWLAEFAYRIDIQWWVFILAGLIAAVISLFTVSFHSFKAALNNPVEALRNE